MEKAFLSLPNTDFRMHALVMFLVLSDDVRDKTRVIHHARSHALWQAGS